MFTIQAKPTFKADVEIPLPDGTVGTLKVVFKHKGRKALTEYLATFAPKDGVEGSAAREDSDALMEIIDSWSGADQAFSVEALDTLLNDYPAAAKAFFDTYLPAMTEGRTKNSKKP